MVRIPTLATKVRNCLAGSSPGTVNLDPNFHVTYINPSNITLQITVPALSSGANGDANLPFLVGSAGGQVYLGVVNGSGTTPTGTAILTIGSNPIIYGITSSSSFTEVSGGALPALAPYDMFSVFGASFCSSLVTFPAVGSVPAYSNGGCGNTTILSGSPDSVYHVFPFSLTPDSQILPTPPTSSLWRNLSVTLFPHGTITGGLPAPLLFATNGQINAIVPGAAVAGNEYDVYVNFGPSGAVASSAAFPVNIVAADPGIFTIGSDGQGSAAALANPSYALINSSNPAGMRSGTGNSDTIQLYVTGLGVPPSPTSSTCAPSLTGSGNYLTALNGQTSPAGTFSNIDGAVIEDTLLGSELPPCLYALTHGTQPTATVGGQPAVVSYAAFVGNGHGLPASTRYEHPATFFEPVRRRPAARVSEFADWRGSYSPGTHAAADLCDCGRPHLTSRSCVIGCAGTENGFLNAFQRNSRRCLHRYGHCVSRNQYLQLRRNLRRRAPGPDALPGRSGFNDCRTAGRKKHFRYAYNFTGYRDRFGGNPADPGGVTVTITVAGGLYVPSSRLPVPSPAVSLGAQVVVSRR